MTIQPGIYEHYKGNRYQVIGHARHSETLEELIVYQAIEGDQKIWVRPSGMFAESVVIDGKTVPRFRLISGT